MNLSPRMEFHISRQARDRYAFDQTLFSITGNVVFANFHAARVFAEKMNAQRDLVHFPEQAVSAGQLNAMGLIDEISHRIISLYRAQINPNVTQELLAWLETRLGGAAVDKALALFCDQFPPVAVYQRETDATAYLQGETEGVPNRQIAVEEMLVLWISNANPAFAPFRELFDDAALKKRTAYPKIITEIQAFLDNQPNFGAKGQHLIEMLRAPALAAPNSLTDQLEYIRTHWGVVLNQLGKSFFRILSSLDLIREEEKVFVMGMGGPGPVEALEFGGMDEEIERFSPDSAWMPRVVLIAKNTYVWMDQLSKKYQRDITRLDQIPDEELEQLAQWGFTGLWLIGLWERSPASQRIKHLCGNPDAVASAYALFDTIIAADLGGEAAYDNLYARAQARGIRLAADMVPNHTGIYSKWVLEHPDWFIHLDYPPFPSYTFNGPNLSEDPDVGIYLEDHYYTRTDAAVVFKRVDRRTGREQYIYHGNDGTSMPWNDTAQLNYLNPEAREAVIQTILQVARKFSVIRFDAAMTLAKRHIQRLWFPEAGSGGAIASRAEHSLSKLRFNQLIPNEFWAEVVDRVAQEVPDTLLLAEAFWMMEGYFVRTLGMHRVYNSAFMHLLRDEENAKYRTVIKNTLEFDPEILKRYANFMNNPDEEPAAEQFGKDGKYFGICMLMCTMPGMPMFGHGQVEGFHEKYGMEFRRARWEEIPNRTFIARHEREIFPLIRRRALFAEVENFLLYDFTAPNGPVNENVFAYSNRLGDERALVLYHNAWGDAHGWIKTSAAYSVKTGQDDERTLIQRSLAEGLALPNDPNTYLIFRDHITSLEHIHNCQQIHQHGFYAELSAYQYKVYLDFRLVQEDEWNQYRHLTDYLNGRGVPDLEEARAEIFLQPVLHPFKELVNPDTLREIIDNRLPTEDPEAALDAEIIQQLEEKITGLIAAVQQFAGAETELPAAAKLPASLLAEAQALLQLPGLTTQYPLPRSRKYKAAHALLQTTLPADDTPAWGAALAWVFTHALGKTIAEEEYALHSRSWLDEWLLAKLITSALQDLGADSDQAWHTVTLLKLLTTLQGRHLAQEAPKKQRAYQTLRAWLQNPEAQQYLQVNRYKRVLWYNKENFQTLCRWVFLVTTLDHLANRPQPAKTVAQNIVAAYEIVNTLLEADEIAGYQLDALLAAAKG